MTPCFKYLPLLFFTILHINLISSHPIIDSFVGVINSTAEDSITLKSDLNTSSIDTLIFPGIEILEVSDSEATRNDEGPEHRKGKSKPTSAVQTILYKLFKSFAKSKSFKKRFCTNPFSPHAYYEPGGTPHNPYCQNVVPVDVHLQALETVKGQLGPVVRINVTVTNKSKRAIYIYTGNTPISDLTHSAGIFNFTSREDPEGLPHIGTAVKGGVYVNETIATSDKNVLRLAGGAKVTKSVEIYHERDVWLEPGDWDVEAKGWWTAVWMELKKNPTVLELKRARRGGYKSGKVVVKIPKKTFLAGSGESPPS